jgi:3-mercaptopyruvate sulfurtransferase SseA
VQAAENLRDPVKAGGKDFDFHLPNSLWATEEEVDKIVAGKSTTQLVEVKPKLAVEKEGLFPKAINLSEIDVFSHSHHTQETAVITQILRDKKIDIEKPIILVGVLPKACVVKLVLHYMGYNNVRICDTNFKQYTARVAQQKKEKEEKDAAAKAKADAAKQEAAAQKPAETAPEKPA